MVITITFWIIPLPTVSVPSKGPGSCVRTLDLQLGVWCEHRCRP